MVAERDEAAAQPGDPDERTAPFQGIERGGGEDGEAQKLPDLQRCDGRPRRRPVARAYRPRNLGGRFSRKARVPSL